MAVMMLAATLPVADVERSIAFYGALGFVLKDRQSAGARLVSGVATIALDLRPDRRVTGSRDGIALTFEADDVLAAWDSLRDAGGAPDRLELTARDTLRFAAADPDGYPLAVEQPVRSISLTKTRLHDLIHAERAAFDVIAAAVPAERFAEPDAQGKWSPKDILAHIAAWERRGAMLVEAGLRGVKPEFLVVGDVDAWNDRVWKENRDLPLDAVREEYRAAHEAILALIATMTDADLGVRYHVPWLDGMPLWVVIGYNTFDHYPRHGARIRAWLGR